jgi:dipeptidyl aminopeptidase/acylaminoacyl peptidase
VVDFYGPAELTRLYQDAPGTRPYLSTFLGGTPDQLPSRYRAASPADNVTRNDPPFMILQGTVDTAVPPSQSVLLDQALEAARVPVKAEFVQGEPHGFRFNVGFDLRGEILAFLNAALNGKGAGSG